MRGTLKQKKMVDSVTMPFLFNPAYMAVMTSQTSYEPEVRRREKRVARDEETRKKKSEEAKKLPLITRKKHKKSQSKRG